MSEQPLILIVDDDEAVVATLRIRLQRGGYRVVSRNDGCGGLDAARRLSPALILLDQCMPAMNGFDVLDKLQLSPATRDIPVAMISGAGIEPWQALSSGAAALLPKPCRKDELLDLVDSLVLPQYSYSRDEDGVCRSATLY